MGAYNHNSGVCPSIMLVTINEEIINTSNTMDILACITTVRSVTFGWKCIGFSQKVRVISRSATEMNAVNQI